MDFDYSSIFPLPEATYGNEAVRVVHDPVQLTETHSI